MRYTPILEMIKKNIKPKEQIGEIEEFLKDLNAQINREKIKASAVLGGSYAKGTHLAGDYDVDIFVKFSPSYADDEMSNLLERILKKWNPKRLHGSRDYFWVHNAVRFEIVPVLDIKHRDDSRNVTDFSPLHVEWVNKNGKKFKDDIRLCKQFCKAQRCYGAESYIRGLSGHVVDLLTIHFKGFVPLLKAAAKWKPKVVIDVPKAYKGDALLVLNKSKTQGPLIVIDPVQKERNAAAALSQENFDLFVSAAKSFLKKPSEEFFTIKPTDFSKLKKKGHLVRVKVQSRDQTEDIAGTKFVRAFEFVLDALSEFGVIAAGWEWDKKKDGEWWFVLKDKELSKLKTVQGPPLSIPLAVEAFKKKHKKTTQKQGRIFAQVPRMARTPREVMKECAKSDIVRSRVAKVAL